MCSKAIHTSLTPGTTNVYVGLSLTFDIRAKWTSRMMVSGLGWKSSKKNLLCALHIAHAAVVHRSISSFGSLSNMLPVKRKIKICCMGIAFLNLTTVQSPQIISQGAFPKSMAYRFSMLVAHQYRETV